MSQRNPTLLPRLLETLPVGKKVNRWTVTGLPQFKLQKPTSRKRRWVIAARCDCGTAAEILCQSLVTQWSKSCGCLNRGAFIARITKHGGSRTKLYGTWHAMLERCRNSNGKYFAHYGGKGVYVCDAWRADFAAFRDWALANGWRPDLEIDRIDNDGPYSPGNCRWATRAQQNRNRTNNLILEAFGESKCLVEWAEDHRCAVDKGTLASRIRYGWTAQDAISIPVTGLYQDGAGVFVKHPSRTD